MAKSGLVAVASLDGGPVDRADSVTLGLHGANDARHLDGAILRTTDGEIAAAADYASAGSRMLAFLGETREADTLAHALGIPGADTATLALHALAHWQDGRGTELPGEWSLMQWDEERRELIVAASPARRDQVFVAQRDGRVAVSPSLDALANLPWVGSALDDAGLARGLARRELRNADRHATMLAAVTRLPPGEMVRIDARGRRIAQIAEPPPPEPWRGDFEDAVAALDAALRAEVRAAIAPHRSIAVLVSGGLDSSLLACIVAEERRADQDVVLLCSVASDESGLPDEREFATMVARATGLPLRLIVPDPAIDLFDPTWVSIADGGPSLRTTHNVSTTMERVAQAHGATLLIEGNCGEDHVSREVWFRNWREQPREWARALRRFVTETDRTGQVNFHVHLAPNFLARLPDEFRRRPSWRGVRPVSRDALIGGPISFSTPFAPTSVADHDLRYAMPYRARSLQRLAAGMPAAFTERDGLSRALARAMLRGRVPDAIRLRPSSPLSPSADHTVELRRQVAVLPDRIARFRDEGIGDIVDLDWLERMATRIGAHGVRSWTQIHAIQSTAMLASFLSRWQQRS